MHSQHLAIKSCAWIKSSPVVGCYFGRSMSRCCSAVACGPDLAAAAAYGLALVAAAVCFAAYVPDYSVAV